VAERARLHEEVPQGGGFLGTGYHPASARVSGELVQEPVPGAAPHDVHDPGANAGEHRELLERAPIAVGQALEYEAASLAAGGRHGSPGVVTGRRQLRHHAAALAELRRIEIDHLA